jgi:hypothetical protein
MASGGVGMWNMGNLHRYTPGIPDNIHFIKFSAGKYWIEQRFRPLQLNEPLLFGHLGNHFIFTSTI